jgi:hypothetical protein
MSAAEGGLAKTILVAEGNSEGFREQAKRTKTAFTRMEPNRVFPAFCLLWSEKIPTLGHNLALISVLYSGERLEITPQDAELNKAKTTKLKQKEQ